MLARTLFLAATTFLGATTPDGGVVAIKGRHLLAEVAKTPRERERALAFRAQFKAERCMFVDSERDRPHPVRTRKFLLPFDILWVDEGGSVVEVLERVPPCRTGRDCPEHGGRVTSRYYLFLASGMVRRLGVKVGDRVQWDLQFSDGTTLRNGAPIAADLAAPPRKRPARKRTR